MARLWWLITLSHLHCYEAVTFWPHGIIPYSIGHFDGTERRLLFNAIEAIERLSCVRFVPAFGSESGLVHFEPAQAGEGCWSSFTGCSGAGQTVNLERRCFDEATIFHELMHVLGFLHEHNRPDRDDHVLIIWERVKRDKLYAFQKRNISDDYFIDRLTDYDHNSVMHYSEFAFGLSMQPTMISKKGKRLGGTNVLSPLDVYRLNIAYECFK